MTNIAINGFGRIGKLVMRRLFDQGLGTRIKLINDLNGSISSIANSIEFDSVHGGWIKPITVKEKEIIIDGSQIKVCNKSTIPELKIDISGIDLVIDCTGVNKDFKLLNEYLQFGVRTVLVSAPIKDDRILNIVYGVNHQLYDQAQNKIITAASCTTNCLAPIVKVLHENIGIKHGSITTIHNLTNSQTILDKPSKNLRRDRAALNSLIPSTTGSATAISLIFPNLKGKLNGHAVRVPVMNASLIDCVFELETKVKRAQINQLFRSASKTELRGILGVEERELVSSDFCNNPLSTIIDAPSTLVVNETQLKIYAWYDNEWSYACRIVDIIAKTQ